MGLMFIYFFLQGLYRVSEGFSVQAEDLIRRDTKPSRNLSHQPEWPWSPPGLEDYEREFEDDFFCEDEEEEELRLRGWGAGVESRVGSRVWVLQLSGFAVSWNCLRSPGFKDGPATVSVHFKVLSPCTLKAQSFRVGAHGATATSLPAALCLV